MLINFLPLKRVGGLIRGRGLIGEGGGGLNRRFTVYKLLIKSDIKMVVYWTVRQLQLQTILEKKLIQLRLRTEMGMGKGNEEERKRKRGLIF